MVLGPRKSFQIGLFVFAHRTRLPNTDRRMCDMCSNSGPIMLLASYHGIKDRSSCNKNMATTIWNLIIDTMNGCGCVVTATSCHLQTELDSAADPLVQSNRISPKLRCNSYSIQPVTPPPYRGAEYCDERVCPPSLCVFICLSTIISLELHVGQTPISPFLCMLPMGVARSSSGGVVISYVLPVIWMTSYLLISQGCSTSPPSWSAVHTQPWAEL